MSMNTDAQRGSSIAGLIGLYAYSIFGVCIIPAVMWWCAWCYTIDVESDDNSLPPDFAKLLPLHAKLGRPQPGDWLQKHYELGQTYEQYLRSHPVRADDQRRVIYVQPLGEFSPAEKNVVALAAEYLGVYFQLPVKVQQGLPLKDVPPTARRKHGKAQAEQVLTSYLIDDVLKPRLPADAVAMIGFTTVDLWPGEGWNRVYGQAALMDRVGVWSIYCFGSPADGDSAFQRCLLRTMKTATHETAHMFSMPHCTVFECNICGANNLPEADRHPAEPCPVCLAKLCYATGADPAKRFQNLIEFYEAHGFTTEQECCKKSLVAAKAE